MQIEEILMMDENNTLLAGQSLHSFSWFLSGIRIHVCKNIQGAQDICKVSVLNVLIIILKIKVYLSLPKSVSALITLLQQVYLLTKIICRHISSTQIAKSAKTLSKILLPNELWSLKLESCVGNRIVILIFIAYIMDAHLMLSYDFEMHVCGVVHLPPGNSSAPLTLVL